MQTYLALGDSYTIGEQVQLFENFPYQTVQMLRSKGFHIAAPEIIAKTGWTTDELSAQMAQTTFLETYNFVSLLIGVNNQYRGRAVDEFENEFIDLLKKAIQLAGNDPQKVFVLSIPDWGVTPFAHGRSRESIAAEIDLYNSVCQRAAASYNTHFIDITTAQRPVGHLEDFLAADGLHPNSNEYKKWAVQLAGAIESLT